jgi:hypothetical protein
MKLTDQQKEFFGAMEGTFRTPGWTLMLTGWKNERDSLYENLFHNAKSMDDMYAARVRYNLLNELIELDKTIARQRTAIEESDDEDNEIYV